jgi:hypothetical protein
MNTSRPAAATPGAERFGRLREPLVDAAHHWQHRHDRERQHRMHHADQHACERRNGAGGLVHETERERDRRQDAGLREQQHPCVGLDEVAGPERQHDPQQPAFAHPVRDSAQQIRDGIAEHDRERGREQRNREGNPQHLGINRRAGDAGELLEADRAVAIDEAALQDLAHRHDKKHQQEQQRRQHGQEAQPGGEPRAAASRCVGGAGHA